MRFCVGSGQSGHTWPSVRHSLVPWDRSIVNPFHSDIASCPGIWKSKLQDCIAVSTGHAQYIALSLALRQVLPFYRLVREAIAIIQPSLSVNVPRVVVYEDNSAALTLAQTWRLTPRTHFYNVILHHWWEAVENGDIKVEFVKIETSRQLADYLTKPLPREPFVIARMGNQGI